MYLCGCIRFIHISNTKEIQQVVTYIHTHTYTNNNKKVVRNIRWSQGWYSACAELEKKGSVSFFYQNHENGIMIDSNSKNESGAVVKLS